MANRFDEIVAEVVDESEPRKPAIPDNDDNVVPMKAEKSKAKPTAPTKRTTPRKETPTVDQRPP